MVGADMKKFGKIIARVINKENLTREETREAFSQILGHQQPEMQQGAFLAALAAKGETIEEIAGCWEAIYQLDTVKITLDTKTPAVENCGTGMDSVKTFNISTAASIIAAAADIPMARHGSRAVTSSCGTVDLLEELGINVECSHLLVKRSIERAGIGIFNGTSPRVHPRALGRILSQISFGTILNTAASLANPALPAYGVRGVHSRELLHRVPLIMAETGYKKALVVHGLAADGKKGMDEASLLGKTLVAELGEGGGIRHYSFTPEDMGLKRGREEDLKPSPRKETEARRLIKLLKGEEKGPREDIVSLNAALILHLRGKARDLPQGIHISRDLIKSGRALAKLREWVAEQNDNPQRGLTRLKNLEESRNHLQETLSC